MTEAVIRAARSFWQLGDVPIRLIAARENKVFRVERPEGPAALRLHRAGYRSDAELQSELMWMAMLAEAGIAVPAPIAGADGQTLMVHDGIAVDLLSWIDGVPLSERAVGGAEYRALGAMMAHMHDLADAWVPPRGFNRPTWDLVGDAPTWGRFWENPTLDAGQAAVFRSFRDVALGRLAGGDWDLGLIHADLVPENVLVDGTRLCPIDFDDGGYGPRLFDIATVTFRSRRSDPTGNLALAVADGYAEVRPFEREALVFFEALRACTYVGWIVPRMGEEGAEARNARFISEALAALGRLDA